MRNKLKKVFCVLLSASMVFPALASVATYAEESVPEDNEVRYETVVDDQAALSVIAPVEEAATESEVPVLSLEPVQEAVAEVTGDDGVETDPVAVVDVEETQPAAEVQEAAKEAAPEVTEAQLAALAGLNFSSKRILVGTSDASILKGEPVIASYGSIHLLQFSDELSAKKAYILLKEKADFVEVDSGIGIAEGEAYGNVSTGTVMTENSNPLSELESTHVVYGYDIAVIDTGAAGADASVSVIGDNAGDDNGHGSAVLGYIREQAPSASVLSIKALNGGGVGDVSAVYAAIEYAINARVRIINLSVSALASADSQVIASAIAQANGSGIIVVGAAGNNGRDASMYVPGGVGSAVIVGAASANGNRLASSNFGATVDYNVVASSSSEAAARMSGFIAANGFQ